MKDKEKILKAVREKRLITYKGGTVSLSANFSAEILQDKKDTFKVTEGEGATNQE